MNQRFVACYVLLFASAACASTAVTPQQLDDLRQARALMADDPDSALTITDRLLREQPAWREARLVAAEGSLALSRQQRSNTRELLDDAARNYERALAEQSADADAWLGLAEARYGLGDFDGSKAAAAKAAELLQGPGGDRDKLQRAWRQRAQCSVQQFAALRRAEEAEGTPDADGFVKPDKATLESAQQALQDVHPVLHTDPAAGYPMAVHVYRRIGQSDSARLELERGLRLFPAESALHLAYQDMYAERGDLRALGGAYARLAREQPGQPLVVWYQGRAQVMIADDLRRKGSFQPAIDAYRRALEHYGQYRAMVPAHAASADEWRAICEIAIARTAIDLGDLLSARQHLFAADQASPKAVQYEAGRPALVDSFGAHYAGVVFAISRALSESGEGALRKTLEFNEEILARHPGKWGFVYNNAALPARDLGVAAAARANRAGLGEEERKAALAEAMALFERSYAHYQEAARLSPEDPRIVNDCGLMLVYHLNRDFDRARELFQRAIEIGQAELDALPPDASSADRQFLEEAVGDALQNTAVLMARHLHRPWEEIRPFCERAVKYFPYERRQAAAMLRAGGAEQDPQAGDRARTFARARQDADKKAGEGDLDGALAVLDEHQKELKDHAPFCALRGELTLRYAIQRRDQGKTTGLDFLFADAVAQLARAVELDGDPAGPRLQLSRAQLESGRTEEAAATASALLLHLQSQGGGAPQDVEASHRVRAEAGARVYAAEKQAGRDKPDLLQAVRTSFRHLEQKDRLDPALCALWSTTELWAGAPSEAANVWARSLKQRPDDPVALAGVVDAAASAGEPAIAVAALKGRRDAAGLWYLGKAGFLLGHDRYTAGKHKEAIDALDEAKTCFQRSMTANPGFRDSSLQWIAMCDGKKGCVAYAAERFDDAEKWLLEAAGARPDRIAENLGGADSIKRGIIQVADRYVGKDLAAVVRIYRAAAAAAHADLDILNNLGLFARDRAVALERAGKRDEAAALYEESYAAYTKAQQLDPKNVRLRNDRALILVHHLGREWELSKQLLEEAIADGDARLRDDPPQHEGERQQLEEAVGDCWENLALWQLRHGKDAALAKAAAEKSLQYHPGALREGAQRHLRAAEALGKKGG